MGEHQPKHFEAASSLTAAPQRWGGCLCPMGTVRCLWASLVSSGSDMGLPCGIQAGCETTHPPLVCRKSSSWNWSLVPKRWGLLD